MRVVALFLALGLMGCERQPFPEPCAASPATVNFGLVEVVGPGKSIPLTLRNNTENLQQVRITQLPFPFFAEPTGLFSIAPFGGSQKVFVTFKPTDGRLSVSEVVMNTESGTCDVTVPLRGLGSGSLRSDPKELEFILTRGETQTQELHIANTRRVAVKLEFTRPPGVTLTLPTERELAPGATMLVQVKAKLDDWLRHDGVVTVTTQFERLEIPVAIIPSSPRLEVTPTPPVDIPVIGFPGSAQRTFRIRNVGNSGDLTAPPLEVTSFGLGNREFFDDFRISPVPFTQLGEGDSMEIAVTIIPQGTGSRHFDFTLATNTGGLAVPITFRNATLPPCKMTVSPADRVALHEVPDGGLEGSVSFANVGTYTCTVDGVTLTFATPDEFSIAGVENQQFRVLPGAQQEITVAGPRQADAGVIGGLRYQVFQTYADVQTLPIEAP